MNLKTLALLSHLMKPNKTVTINKFFTNFLNKNILAIAVTLCKSVCESYVRTGA